MRRKRTRVTAGSDRNEPDRSPSIGILAKARAPMARAFVSLASVMLADAALAQDPAQKTSQETAGESEGKPTQKTAPADGGTLTLDPVDVVAGSGGSDYNPRSLGLKRLPTPILDTPQSITVVPQQLIRDQQDTTVVEALRNVPGITFFGGEGGTQGDNIAIRGYSARNDFYRDGVRDPGWYTRDTFSVDRMSRC